LKNHSAGFGPATAKPFRKMVGLSEVVWEEMKQARLDWGWYLSLVAHAAGATLKTPPKKQTYQ